MVFQNKMNIFVASNFNIMKKTKLFLIAATILLLSACSTSRGCGCLSMEMLAKFVVELVK